MDKLPMMRASVSDVEQIRRMMIEAESYDSEGNRCRPDLEYIDRLLPSVVAVYAMRLAENLHAR